MDDTWDPRGAGVLRLPSGRLLRGRGLRRPVPDGPPATFAVHLLGSPPPAGGGIGGGRAGGPTEIRWLRWPDFRLPADPAEARRVLAEAWDRAATERVEIA